MPADILSFTPAWKFPCHEPVTKTVPIGNDRARLSWWALFAWLCVTVGFTLGTLTLLGPVRRMTTAIRVRDGSQGIENVAVVLAIAVLVAVTAALSYYLTGHAMRGPRRWARIIVPLVAALPAGLALWAWMTPEVMARVNAKGQSQVVAANFTFGPYPDEAKLRELKAEGYTAVVTLLHPAVVPFEPMLLARETEAAGRVGISLIHLPMLPWVSNNAEPLAAVRRLAASREGRYYVHCYLGVDRVNVVRRVVEHSLGIEGRDAAEGGTGRSIEALVTAGIGFERGRVVKLAEGVFLTPYPTEEEWNSFIIGGNVRTVVSLLDPQLADDRPWIAKERELLGSPGITFINAPIPASGLDRAAAHAAARAAAAAARRAKKPVVVHGFLSPSLPANAFVQAYQQAYPGNAVRDWIMRVLRR